MILTEEVKTRIIEILDSVEFTSDLYEGLTEEKRDALGQVYTPARVCIQMIESFSCDTLTDKTILDPEDDAAIVHWGSDWRMPTIDEWLELKQKCSWKKIIRPKKRMAMSIGHTLPQTAAIDISGIIFIKTTFPWQNVQPYRFQKPLQECSHKQVPPNQKPLQRLWEYRENLFCRF